MYLSLPLLIGIGVAVLALLFVVTRRGGPRDLITPPRAQPAVRPAARSAPAGPVTLPPDVEAEVRALMSEDRKIDAIKLVREVTGLGLGEAKDLVERF